MYVSAIVLAAGRGMRLRRRIPKPLVKINSQPLLTYSLKVLNKHRYIRDIVIALSPFYQKEIMRQIRKEQLGKIRQIVVGGRRRQDSVFNALQAIDRRTDLVLIHDSARPFINRRMVSAAIKAAGKYGASITGVPLKATIKEIKNQKSKIKIVEKTLNRNSLWEIQTPQVFRKELILKAYQRFGDSDVTDDASLVERLGEPVGVVEGSYFNIKITTPEDLTLAKAIARRCNTG